jgi:hypothetical protein
LGLGSLVEEEAFVAGHSHGDGALRYRPSGIEAFIDERERLSALRRRA